MGSAAEFEQELSRMRGEDPPNEAQERAAARKAISKQHERSAISEVAHFFLRSRESDASGIVDLEMEVTPIIVQPLGETYLVLSTPRVHEMALSPVFGKRHLAPC